MVRRIREEYGGDLSSHVAKSRARGRSAKHGMEAAMGDDAAMSRKVVGSKTRCKSGFVSVIAGQNSCRTATFGWP